MKLTLVPDDVMYMVQATTTALLRRRTCLTPFKALAMAHESVQHYLGVEFEFVVKDSDEIER